ncbi:tRNA methyltransferase RSM22 [Sporobolomyces salmoneus]|uniref:tRNA methyltransferase RSM22 n=1 Tax=Sporobolomyces salmoneus TaxID=183962 RepID=UPI00316E830C
MLVRTARTKALLGTRGASGKALDRLLLDIHAAHNADQQRGGEESAAPIEKSPAAQLGETMRGDVVLPRELQTAVNAVVDSIEDKSILRNTALDLYAHLRKTTAILSPPASYREKQALTLNYDEDVSLAYLAGLMPSVYAATLNVLSTTKSRLDSLKGAEGEEWDPDRILDFGSGTGSAAWAFEEVFGVAKRDGTAREYVGLDASREMVELSSGIFGAFPLRRTDDGQPGTQATSTRLDAKSHQMALPASASSLAKLQISSKSSETKKTIALAAFLLGDLPTKEKRKELIKAMWQSGAEVLIVIDRGTPAGSRIVIEAREQLLGLGRREFSRAVANEIDPELAVEGLEIVVDPEVAAEVEVDPALGSHVIAPCPHDKPCPLHHVTKAFCHFSQRVQTPPFLRLTKHTTRGEDDAKFSYVVVRRGQRPVSSPTSSSFSNLMAELDQTVEGQEETGADAKEETRTMEWPRLIAPPLKRSGHVILEVCSASGEIERHTIPKSQGRQEYYDARKSAWGDLFPHAPKNGPQPSPSTSTSLPTAPVPASNLVTDDIGKPKNKFGGSFKGRSNKAAREHGKREARGMREVETGRKGRRDRREDARLRKTGLWDDHKSSASDGGVKEYNVELGDDGEFKVVH